MAEADVEREFARDHVAAEPQLTKAEQPAVLSAVDKRRRRARAVSSFSRVFRL